MACHRWPAAKHRVLRQSAGLLLLIALALGSSWLAMMGGAQGPPPRPAENSPAYFVEGLTLTALDEQGRPRHVLRSERLAHYDRDGRTELAQPSLTVYDGSEPPWMISASSGWVSQKGDLVLLQGEVTIVREETGDSRPLRVHTSELRVLPEEEYAETDQFVQVFSRNDWIESTGAKVWFAEPVRIKFLSEVRAYHEVE